MQRSAMATGDVCQRLEEYITEDELHERYLIPPRTAQRWRQDGAGPKFIRLGQRRIVYRVSDVETWLADRAYAHRADELARTRF